MFNYIRQIHSSLSDLYIKQATMMQEQFGSFYKYYREELGSLKDVHPRRPYR